jgi:ribosomal protein S18 acetylase RimI-like enzyme
MAMVLKDMETSQREGGSFCGVYTADGSLIGVVDVVPGNFEADPHIAFLSLLMIAVSHRRKGIGTAVVGLVEHEIMKDAGIKAILTAVQVNNPQALRFWQKHGYHIVGGRKPQPDRTTTVLLRKDCNLKTQGGQFPIP